MLDTHTLPFCLMSARRGIIFALFHPLSEQIPYSCRKLISFPNPKGKEEASCPKEDLTPLLPQKTF